MSKFSWRYVQSIFFLWLLWGLFRVPLNSFSGEVVSRRFTISQALAAGRWAQSQNVDTLFYDRDKTQSFTKWENQATGIKPKALTKWENQATGIKPKAITKWENQATEIKPKALKTWEN
jgi:hypothetical protein